MLRWENRNCSKLLLAGFLKGTQSSKTQVHSWCSSLAQMLKFGSKIWTCLGGERSRVSPKLLLSALQNHSLSKTPGLLYKAKAKMLCNTEKKKKTNIQSREPGKSLSEMDAFCRFMPHPVLSPCSMLFIISLTLYTKAKKFLWCRRHSNSNHNSNSSACGPSLNT